VTDPQAGWKRQAAETAADEVQSGMAVGLGTGSTAIFATRRVGARLADGTLRDLVGFATSEETQREAEQLGIPLLPAELPRELDLTIDGADEVERGTLHLIKGLGGALLHEKIVAAASARMIVVVDDTKVVDRLGTRGRLPVEVVAFGWQTVLDRLREAGVAPRLRAVRSEDDPFVTDAGNYVADCTVTEISDPAVLERRLATLVGVVESGLFVGLASRVIVGGPTGVSVLDRSIA
jgi:ribose 5-phosphate isomerase A